MIFADLYDRRILFLQLVYIYIIILLNVFSSNVVRITTKARDYKWIIILISAPNYRSYKVDFIIEMLLVLRTPNILFTKFVRTRL